jgi:EpsI family protein
VIDPADGTDFYLAYFARQGEGNEMIAFGNAVLQDTDKTWSTMSRGVQEIVVSGAPLRVQEWRIRSAAGERLVWSWYTVGGVGAHSDYGAKGLTTWSMLRGRGDHSTIAVVATQLPLEAAGAQTDALLASARLRLARAADPVARYAARATAP